MMSQPPPRADQHVHSLWLRLAGNQVARREAPTHTWDRGDDADFGGLLGVHADTYRVYDGQTGHTVQLRVDFVRGEDGSYPAYNIWSIMHPTSRKHLFECGWTLAEFTYQNTLNAEFSGVVGVDGADDVYEVLREAFKDVATICVKRIDPAFDLSDAIVVSSEPNYSALRDRLARSGKCRVIISTVAKPAVDDKALIEIYPERPQKAEQVKLWLPPLIKKLAKGRSPEEALRDVFHNPSPKLENSGIRPGSLRLRNATQKWDSRPYAMPYYKEHVEKHVEPEGGLERDGRVRVLVSPAADLETAVRLASSLYGCIRCAQVVSQRIAPDDAAAHWVNEIRRRARNHADLYEEDEGQALPLWIVHAIEHGDRLEEKVVLYVSQVCDISRMRVPVFLYLVVEDRDEQVRATLEDARRDPSVANQLTILPRMG